MKRPRLLLPALIAFLAGGLPAADLAPGLAYLRPGTELSPQTGSAVIDLRTVTDETVARPLLAAIEPGKTNERRILLVLVSPETPSGVRRQLATLPRCLTLGRADPESDFKTDISVTTSAEAERKALEALAAGTAPEKLLVENADKPRFDETSLIREHTAMPETAITEEEAKPASANPAEPAPVDAVLQRAVQIYRGLIVLKKT
jgi:hypothetical protein